MGSKTSIAESCNELYGQRNPQGVPTAAWVQFRFHLVVGGTEAGRPAKAGACQGTWFLFDFVRGAGKNGRQCVGIPSRLPFRGDVRFGWCDNDPSAGSPTETLLRLHLPLNDKVWTSSHSQAPMKEPNHNPESSPDHSIGRCDGRCVQRAGT